MPSTRTRRTHPTTRLDHVLVIGRRSHDAVPLRVFKTRRGAKHYAATVTETHINKTAHRVFGGDALYVHFVALIEFRGGQPGPFEVVKDLTE